MPMPNPLDLPAFTTEQCDALFAAVLVHDDLYPDAKLPATIELDYRPEQLAQCYRLCRQIWQQGVDREALLAIIDKIGRQQVLGPEDQRAFKEVRAKFKHLRFAYAAFDQRHRYPLTFHWLIALMGSLQDAFKNRQVVAVRRYARVLRLLLQPWPYAVLTRRIDQFQASTTASFQRYVQQQLAGIRSSLGKDAVTSKAFHEMRKVISRQVAIYDCLKILYPTPEHHAISQSLSTINGLMGSLHDELIARKFNKTQDYHADKFAIPTEIRRRLLALTESYPPS